MINHHKKTTMRLLINSLIVAIFISAFSFKSFAQPDGAKVFKANCASCHSTSAKRGTGPGLEGFWDRIPGGDEEGKKAWVLKWVKNPGGVLSSGDAYANSLKDEYGTVMTGQAHLSDEEIMAVVDYVKSEPHKQETVAQVGGEVKQNPFSPKEKHSDGTSLLWLGVLGLIFLVIIYSISGINKSLARVLATKNGQEYDENDSFFATFVRWTNQHKVLTGLAVICLLLFGATKGWYALKGVGVYQGYAPEQPIKFSHKIHAGENGIACVYCHHSAEKGKNAGIPSVNVCMNCHKGINEGTWTGTTEIAKIYEAAGWNPELQKYDQPQKPIKWVRIHNLPDFTYFNHSQHVVAGKQKCQTCHGAVEEMTLLEQHAELTMGWCINCHRETQVAMEGNAYYDKMYAELVEKHKEKGLKTFTVEDIGGLECAKCHY